MMTISKGIKLFTITVCLSFVMFQLAGQSLTGLPAIHNITAKDYNSFPQNFAATQDKRGLIYIANTYNVLEYDGVNWRKFPEEGRLLGRSILASSSGHVYVGSVKDFGYLKKNTAGKLEFNSLSNQIPTALRNFTYIINILETKDGIYFQAKEAIYLFKNFKFIEAYQPKGQFSNFQLVDGDLYVSDSKEGLFSLTGHQLQAVNKGAFFLDKQVYHIGKDQVGKQLIFTSSGIYHYHDELENYQLLTETTFLQHLLQSAQVSCIIPLLNGTIAIGTKNKGLIIYESEEEYNWISKDKGLIHNNIHHLFFDQNNRVWAMTGKGISVVDYYSPLRYIDERHGFEGRGYVSTTYQRKLYISGSTGTFKQRSSKQFEQIPNASPSFFLDEFDGKLYSATRENIIQVHENGQHQIIYPKKTWVMRALKHYPNKIIAGTDNGLLIFNQTKTGLQFSHKVKDFHAHSRWIQEDEHGNIWVAFQSKEVIKLRFNANMDLITKKQSYTTKDGLPEQVNYIVYTLNQPNGEAKVIVTTELGLYQYHATTDRFELDPDFELLNGKGFVHPIIQGKSGKIYWQKNGEKGILTPNTQGGYTLYKHPFMPLKGIWSEWIQELDAHRVAFSCGSGLVIYDQRKDYKTPNTFNTRIRKVIAKDSLLYCGNGTLGQGKQVPYAANTLNFEFAATFFEKPELNQYRFQLVGFDETWSEWSTKTEKEYTNLPGGKYTFQVMAKNLYDDESEIVSYAFQILQPWYFSRLAILGYIALGIGFLWLVLWLNSIRMRHQKQKLEAIIREHTEEIHQQKEELEVQAEEIMGQAEHLQLVNERLIKLDQFKQNMTSMIVHDLKNPLGAIIGIAPSGSRIESEAKQMLNLVTNILDVNKFENTDIQLNTKNYTLCEIGRSAMTQVDMLIAEKQIQLDIQVEKEEWVHVDFDLMERVMVNLLTNAIKYTPNNGTITLSSETVANKWVRFGVSDTGQGIPEEQLDQIFDLYRQVEAKNSGKVRSTGLGLTFCKMVVEAHEGDIEVKSTLNQGTTFYLTLPKGEARTESGLGACLEEIPAPKYIPVSLSTEDLAAISPTLELLKDLKIYQASSIRKAVRQIQHNDNQSIIEWKDAILKAALVGNYEVYQELLTFEEADLH